MGVAGIAVAVAGTVTAAAAAADGNAITVAVADGNAVTVAVADRLAVIGQVNDVDDLAIALNRPVYANRMPMQPGRRTLCSLATDDASVAGPKMGLVQGTTADLADTAKPPASQKDVFD